MAIQVSSVGNKGVDGYPIDVQVSIINGIAVTNIVGMADQAVKEARDRIESTTAELGCSYPQKKVIINLNPAEEKKASTALDLPMLLGVLIASEQLNPLAARLEDTAFIGELGLSGELRYFKGALPMVIAAQKSGFKRVVLPTDCLVEGSRVEGIDNFAFDHVRDLVGWLTGTKAYQAPVAAHENKPPLVYPDFSYVQGHDDFLQYLLIAVAGHHNILMIGPPGCGKSMMAKRIPGIMGPMTKEETLEVMTIHSVLGTLDPHHVPRPFRAPHYGASTHAIIGGGAKAMPGEISMAHNGVLFLDEFPEFSRATLEALRQPMEDRKVTIARVKETNSYPANFMLVAAMNPCPCGHLGTGACRCSPSEIKRYQGKLSGPIIDRIDIQKYLRKVKPSFGGAQEGMWSTAKMRKMVIGAKKIQQERYKDLPEIHNNSQLEASHIHTFCPMTDQAKASLESIHDQYQISHRAVNKLILIARTCADLEGVEVIDKSHIHRALMARDLDRNQEMGRL